MESELSNLKNNWQNMEEFQNCIDVLEKLGDNVRDTNGLLLRAGKKKTTDQFEEFFETYIDNWTKQFLQWKSKLLPLCLASDDKTVASTFATWYVKQGEMDESDIETNIFENCSVHGDCFPKMKSWIDFLKSCTLDEPDRVLSKHQHAVQAISEGTNLYDWPPTKIIADLVHDVKQHWYIVPTTAQMVEGAVQESSLCSLSLESPQM